MISLKETAILLAAAVVAVSLFRFLRLSSILGYVAAGLVIGPWGLNLVGDVDRITNASQFGIVLLLFIIGLELQPTRLWSCAAPCSASARLRSCCARPCSGQPPGRSDSPRFPPPSSAS